MHDASIHPRRRTAFLPLGIAAAVTIVAVAVAAGGRFSLPSSISLHAPDWSVFDGVGLPIQLHLAAALVTFAIGTIQLIGVKGSALHRVLGWTWVLAMGTTAVSSLFIRMLNHGAFSLIHLLSGWVIIALPMAVWAARRHKVDFHKKMMTGLFTGGLLVAGLLTFIPGRLMWRLFFG